MVRECKGRVATMAGVAAAGALLGAAAGAATLQEGGSPLRNGTIAYVLTDRYWSVYETEKGATECPKGFNDGPREQFQQLYSDGKKRSIVEAQLKREGKQWHPTDDPEAFPFLEAQGSVSYGLNLDGKVDANDFESPEGEPGIDNQLFRAIGCIAGFRKGGSHYHFDNLFMRSYNDTRIVLELTGVDDLVNDADVTVRTWRGSDNLLTDASGEAFIPGGTQRVDLRWGQDYVNELKGRIVDGYLITDPIDHITFPWGFTFDTTGVQVFRGMQFKLKLSPTNADGLLAGFVDVHGFIHRLNTHLSTHHQSYGQISSPSLYRAMSRLADGYPDPKSGRNTAISSSVEVKFVQVFLQKPAKRRQLTMRK